MKFEWDSIKNDKNRTKHGLSFEEAIEVFVDPNAEKRKFMSKKDKDGFDLSKAKKIKQSRREKFLEAVETKRGRPLKPVDEKRRPISIKIHPEVYDWAKKEAQEKGLGYQTIINETLLDIAKKKKSS